MPEGVPLYYTAAYGFMELCLNYTIPVIIILYKRDQISIGMQIWSRYPFLYLTYRLGKNTNNILL